MFKNPAYYLEVSEIIPIFAVETSLSAISYEDIAGIYPNYPGAPARATAAVWYYLHATYRIGSPR